MHGETRIRETAISLHAIEAIFRTILTLTMRQQKHADFCLNLDIYDLTISGGRIHSFTMIINLRSTGREPDEISAMIRGNVSGEETIPALVHEGSEDEQQYIVPSLRWLVSSRD
jgi:hypothetical protein